MNSIDRWLLPDGIDEVLPPQARNLELLRRQLLDLFAAWGYEYVIPPMVEFLDSLLTGTGRDLDLKTFKVTDRLSGRTMGIRADITPQVARIDAHSLKQNGVTRLCYCGTVLHAKPENMLASRAPIHAGAELFGDSGPAADLEIVSLMVESLQGLKLSSVLIELGDVSIFRELVRQAALPKDTEEQLFELIQKKAMAELRDAVVTLRLPEALQSQLLALPQLCGPLEVLARARQVFASYPAILGCLDDMETVAGGITARFDGVEIYVDLSELRGYQYHTGIVFAAYVDGARRRVATGGRYDSIGKVFGRDRGATGFDLDLKNLARLVSVDATPPRIVVVEAGERVDDRDRWEKMRELRRAGYTVIESGRDTLRHDYILKVQDGEWCLTDPVSH